MKNSILYLFIVLTTNAFSQVVDTFNFQANLRNLDGENISQTQVLISVAILGGSADGNIVFEETHEITTSEYGLINLEIGSVNELNIDWSANDYYLSLSVNGNKLGDAQLLSVPYALFSESTQSADKIDYANLSNLPNWDMDSTNDFSGQYDSLKNRPELFDGDFQSLTGVPEVTRITDAQSVKLDHLSVTESTDVNQLVTDTQGKSDLVEFPGFGSEAGKAFAIRWSEVNDEVFYTSGSVGVNASSAPQFGGATLKVGGAMLLNGITNSTTPGLLQYNAIGPGFFTFRNANGEQKGFGTGSLTYNLGNQQASGDYIIAQGFESEFLVVGKLAVGAQVTADVDFGENTMVFKSSSNRIRFDDTSSSASFPSNDWEITLNDENDGGDNFFAVSDISAGTVPFYVSSGVPEDAANINNIGNIGLGTSSPSEALDVNGNITATSFVGQGKNLSNLNGTGGSGVVNNGSTTIIADGVEDGNGQLIFQTKSQNRLVITNDGNVGIGMDNPLAKLHVNGNLTVGNAQIEHMSVAASPIKITDNPAFTFFNNIDVTGLHIIRFSENQTSVAPSGGISGQIIIMINLNVGQLAVTANNVGYFLNQYESISFINDGGVWRIYQQAMVVAN
ncbi:MAG: hypothetical protein RJQ09_12430 [Cyclobacteriaceae bacterium]